MSEESENALPDHNKTTDKMSANFTTSKNSENATYCVCQSNDDKRFMICCDNCNRWFHGDCMNIKADQAKKIEKYFCTVCRAEKNLSIVFKQKSAPTTDSESEPPKKRQKKECGNCIGCFRTEDCGRCDICKENKNEALTQFRKQKCRLRQCVNFTAVEKPVQRKKAMYERSLPKGPAIGAKLKNVSKKKPGASSTATPMQLSVRHSGPDVTKKGKLSLPAGTTRAGARAYKEFMVEAGLLPDEEVEEVRQCFGPGCVLPARPGSKYCSDDDEACGMKLARARLAEILPGRIQEWNSAPSVAEEFERKRLESIEIQMETARQKLANSVAEDEKLTNWLNDAKSTKADTDGELDDDDDAEMSVYCTTCGHETSAKTALRHIARCFSKYESQTSYGSAHRTFNNIYNIFCDAYNKTSRTYCKRLRVICPEHYKEPKIDDDDICASPLNADTPLDCFDANLVCLTPKKVCLKHYKWDKIRHALIDMERLGQLLKLDELFEEQKSLKATTAARGGILSLMLHRTVKHGDESDR